MTKKKQSKKKIEKKKKNNKNIEYSFHTCMVLNIAVSE